MEGQHRLWTKGTEVEKPSGRGNKAEKTCYRQRGKEVLEMVALSWRRLCILDKWNCVLERQAEVQFQAVWRVRWGWGREFGLLRSPRDLELQTRGIEWNGKPKDGVLKKKKTGVGIGILAKCSFLRIRQQPGLLLVEDLTRGSSHLGILLLLLCQLNSQEEQPRVCGNSEQAFIYSSLSLQISVVSSPTCGCCAWKWVGYGAQPLKWSSRNSCKVMLCVWMDVM